MNITLKVMERNEHGEVVQTGTKVFGPVSSPASDWVKAPRKMWHGQGTKDGPNLSSAIQWKSGYKRVIPSSLAFMVNDSNNVMKNGQSVGMQSWPTSMKTGCAYIFSENWRRCIALFAARKTIKSNWINQKDEYSAPNEEHPDYEQWVDDCHVYSLFQSSSNQSSLRDIDYKGTKWDIENEFFWMSVEEMRELADEHGLTEMYNDTVRFNKDRYMYKELEGLTLSPDAQQVIDVSRELIRESMAMRHMADPKYHLNAWDAGWYQIRKGILEEYYPNEYKAFVEKFKALEDRLREGVYKFGFLNP